IGATHPKVRQRMIVHRYAATEPAIDVIRGALPRQGPGAADPIAGGVKPKRQHKPRRGRRMTRPVLARLDPIFQLSQIEVFHVIPDHPRAVVRADQAVDIDTPKLDLVACGFAQPRRPERGRIALRLRLLRQLAKQFVAAHPRLPRINSCSESQLASLALPCRHDARKIHSLVGWVEAGGRNPSNGPHANMMGFAALNPSYVTAAILAHPAAGRSRPRPASDRPAGLRRNRLAPMRPR